MKEQHSTFARRYVTTLRKYLKQGPRSGLDSARGLGRRAVAIGMETLDVARTHEEALATLEASRSRDGIVERAELFFREAITPIEKIHNIAVQAGAHLKRVHNKLERQTEDLAASACSLKKSIKRRKTIEAALKKSGGHTQKLLRESNRLQVNLKHLTRQLLMAQEDKRKRISKDLQDEIAQTLLGINVRLLTLKKEAALNAEEFKKDIASTQRAVDQSVKSIRRFTHEFGKKHEA